MPEISDPIVTRFVNERLRPRCEQIRALLAQMQDDYAEWNGGVSAEVQNDGGYEINDGRDSEGVDRLTGAEAHTIMDRQAELRAVLEATYAMDAILAGCVRPLEVTLRV